MVEDSAGRFPQISGMIVAGRSRQAGRRPRRLGQGRRRAARSRQDLYRRHQRFHGQWRRRLQGLRRPKQLVNPIDAQLLASQVIDYVAAKGTVAPKPEGRIVTN